MKFAFSMLKEFVDTASSAQQIGDLLTMAGFELEGMDQVEGEPMLDIKVVSNRGDGLSVLGLAREVLAKKAEAKPTALYKRALARFPTDHNSESNVLEQMVLDISAKVSIETQECTRFAAQIFEADLGDFNRPTPERIQKRLRIAGMRPISLLVDLTNYVMLELGQPMHAYDLDTLSGNQLLARKARKGEKLTLLNGDEHELQRDQMIIADAQKPVGVAGVMGGLDTEVTASTRRVLLEAAHFVNTSVRRTRKQLGLSTEASYRFERSVDPEGCLGALNRFAELLEEAMGTDPRVSGVIDVRSSKPEQPRIHVRMSFVNKLLGMEVTPSQARGYLDRLGFTVEGAGEDFYAAAPSWRPDVVQEYDVVEEIGRIHGFELIPESPIQGTTTQGGVFGIDLYVQQVRDQAMRLGFVQNISHSLRDFHPLDAPGTRTGPRNPSSPEMSVLRNSLLPSLVENARRNGGQDLRLFEIGAIFQHTESRSMGLLAVGKDGAEHWENQPSPSATFFGMKGVVEDLWPNLDLENGDDPRLHPTRQARGQGILFGQIHPDIAEEIGLSSETFLAEGDLELLYKANTRATTSKPISRNPAVRRDIAILIDKAVPYSHVEQTISSKGGEILERHWLFDVYEGKGIPEGKHSLAIAIQLRKLGENLTDEEANQVRDSIVAGLGELGATQR